MVSFINGFVTKPQFKKRSMLPQSVVPNKEEFIPKPYRKITENIWIADMRSKKTSPSSCNCYPVRCDDSCLNVMMNIECSPSNCKSSNCENRKFTYLIEDRTVVRYVSKDVGFGLFASQNIGQGDRITQYLGEVIDKTEIRTRHSRDEKHLYFMLLDSNVIDASNCGNDSRFINNSCRPISAFLKWEIDGFEQIGIFANRNILKVSSLTN